MGGEERDKMGEILRDEGRGRIREEDGMNVMERRRWNEGKGNRGKWRSGSGSGSGIATDACLPHGVRLPLTSVLFSVHSGGNRIVGNVEKCNNKIV